MNCLSALKIFVNFFTLLIIFTLQITGFEESIFEDEDIYHQALPPAAPSTGITAPGTKWCGPGNTSTSYHDLGKEVETDKCCRDHDYCKDILDPHTVLHGLNNSNWLPILECSCEQKFINCLQAVNDVISNTLGHIYYGLRNLCFAKGHPIVRCKQYQEGTFQKRCIRYKINKEKPKIWQFYDMPFYAQKSKS